LGEVSSLKILFCPAHYLYENSREGSEFAWAYNIADRIAADAPSSVVVTGKSMVNSKPYRIIELTPHEDRLNFSLLHAFAFNMRYTLATFRALRRERFDVVHHVLPFALGKTYNVAALRHGHTTPFVIGPVQASLSVPDSDVDAKDLRAHGIKDRSHLASIRRVIADQARSFSTDVVAPVAFSGLFRRTIAEAAAVVAVNKEAKALLLKSGVSASRVVVIPPGVDTKRFRPDVRARRTNGLQLLSVCRLVKRKNVDVIIRAFASVVAAGSDARLRIVGDGPQRETLTTLTHALGIGDRVTFAGPVLNANVHEEYQRADVFVSASAAEGFATVCLEALASGLAIVSTRVGGFVDAVEHEHNGYLLAGPDANELAMTLRRLVENPALIANLSSQAREVAERNFDWDTAVIPKYRDLYDRVTRERA
jgi:glycosyltransferase involved in cell wall biosynthesis